MGYTIEALIFPADRRWPGSLMEFPQGMLAGPSQLVMIPLTDETRRRMGEPAEREHVDGFWELTAAVSSFAERLSVHGPVAYVEAEYSGGPGTQGSIVWEDGVIAFGPLGTADDETERADNPGYLLPSEAGGRAINLALRHLGVAADPGADEFDTVGLATFRATDDWGFDDPAARRTRATDARGRRRELLPRRYRYGMDHPPAFLHLVNLGLVFLDPWEIVFGQHLRSIARRFLLRYPGKRYIPFAIRRDGDQVACWLAGDPGRVVVVHDRAAHGREVQGDGWPSTMSWFRAAIDDCIERAEDRLATRTRLDRTQP